MEANIEVEDFELVGRLAWRVLVEANKARKSAEQESLQCRFGGRGIGTTVKQSCSAMPAQGTNKKTGNWNKRGG